MPYCGRDVKNLYDGVWAEVLAFAGFAMLAHPNVIKLLHGLLDDLWNIGQDARLKVALIVALHADAGTREVSAADVHLLAVKNQHLEVNPGAQHPFQPVLQHGIPVKVLPEVRPRLLSMNQPHLNTSPNQQSDNRQERGEVPSSFLSLGRKNKFSLLSLTRKVLILTNLHI